MRAHVRAAAVFTALTLAGLTSLAVQPQHAPAHPATPVAAHLGVFDRLGRQPQTASRSFNRYQTPSTTAVTAPAGPPPPAPVAPSAAAQPPTVQQQTRAAMTKLRDSLRPPPPPPSANSQCTVVRPPLQKLPVALAHQCWDGLLATCNWSTSEMFQIMYRESGGYPWAKNAHSSATGLLQILHGPYDPAANIALGCSMFHQRGYQPWGF